MIDNLQNYLVAAILVLIAIRFTGLIIAPLRRTLKISKTEKTLANFIVNFADITLRVILIAMAISRLGFATDNIVTVITAAGLALGLAFQDILGNFAGGLIIIFNKPYVVGDEITIEGLNGVVQEVEIFNTILKTFDNQIIYIPNKSITKGPIINHTQDKFRRITINFGLGYESDFNKVKKSLLKFANSREGILKRPASEVFINNLGARFINIELRMWCSTKKYWTVREQVLTDFIKFAEKQGIRISRVEKGVKKD